MKQATLSFSLTLLVILSCYLILENPHPGRAQSGQKDAGACCGPTHPTAPRELVLSYNQKLEPAFSSVEVSDASGARVDLGKPRIEASAMRVGLKQLAPGTYRVHWRVLSADTHTSEGSFTFHVGQ